MRSIQRQRDRQNRAGASLALGRSAYLPAADDRQDWSAGSRRAGTTSRGVQPSPAFLITYRVGGFLLPPLIRRRPINALVGRHLSRGGPGRSALIRCSGARRLNLIRKLPEHTRQGLFEQLHPSVAFRGPVFFDAHSIEPKDAEMSDTPSEKSEMNELAFASHAMRERIAPVGSAQYVESRIRLAANRLRWKFSRARDVWYADERVSMKPHELRQIEQVAGVRYGRQEVRDIEEVISRAEALLDGDEADFYRPFVTAVRAMAGAFNRPGTPGDGR